MKLGQDGRKITPPNNSPGNISGGSLAIAPNPQANPAVRTELRAEGQELFTVPDGYKLVGADLSGIELRCLAHFMQDGGAYAKEILEGDIHSANAKAFGGISRDQSKTAVYCLIYGGGDRKLGEAIDGSPRDGKLLRDKFYQNNPAFRNLLVAVKSTVEQKGYLTGLDGRKIVARSAHGQLNVLLQSAAALIAKKWVQLIDQKIKQNDIDAQIIAFVHDEAQLMVRDTEGVAEYVGNNIALKSAREAGEYFRIKIPIDADYSIGKSWRDTH